MDVLGLTRVKQSGLPRWTWPAVWFDQVRPGLAQWAAKDAAWLAGLPLAIRSLIPLAVMLTPIVFAGARALDQTRPLEQVFTFRILDVYVESIPFMVIAAAIGMAAPTLGMLFLATHVVADLAASFIQGQELKPFPTALFGRIVSFWLLYLLVAELPMLAHDVLDAARARFRGAFARPLTVATGAAAATALAYIWGASAPLLIRPVFTWSALSRPSANVGTPLLVAADAFALLVGALTLAMFTVRFMVLPTRKEPAAVADAGAGRSWAPLIFGIVIPIVLFTSVVTKPIDALILFGAVLGARPISAILLRRTGLARPLAVIPRPARLLGGVLLSGVIGFLIATVLGISTISDWFTMNVVMAVGFVLTRTLIDAEEYVDTASGGPSLAAGIAATFAAGMVIWLFSAGWALGNDVSQQGDGYGTAVAAGGAAAAAGGAAAMGANRKKTPNPPPWYIPDRFADFFGYDAPPTPQDTKKQPDWTKPKNTPDGPVY